MKKMTLFIAVALVSFLRSTAQTDVPFSSVEKTMALAKEMRPKYGIKVGYNFAKITGSSANFSPKNQNGFMVSGFYAPPSKGLGYRTELIFSRQGFSFDETGKMQNVTQDYVYMPHFTTYTIAQKVQLQAGGQIGYLLNAKKTGEQSTANAGSKQEQELTDYMNRIDYGAAFGVEVYPFKGLLIGARYNVSMGNLYKHYQTTVSENPTMPIPFPLPVNPNDFKGKNAVVQFFVGYKF